METASGAYTPIRTNLMTNPSIEVNNTNWGFWSGNNGTATRTTETTGGYVGNNFQRLTWTVATTDAAGGSYVDTPVTAGQIYSASARARTNRTGATLVMNFEWRDAGGSQISSDNGVGTAASTNAWDEYKLENKTAPPLATVLRVVVYGKTPGTPWAVGNTLDMDAVMVESTTVVGTYFDGSTAATSDFSYTWAGTAHASQSTLRGMTPTGINQAGSGVGIQSTDWAASGTSSVRVISKYAGLDSYTTVGGDAGAFRLGMQPGKTYTIMAKVRLAAPLTGALQPNRWGRPVVFILGGSYSEFPTNAPTNAIGVYEVRKTFTIPANATEAFIRLYNGTSTGNGDVWYDNVMLVEGEYTGDYIDGSKPFAKWDGVAGASLSVGYPPQLLDFAGSPALDQVGAGSTSNPAVNGFTARTIYAVYEVIDTTTSWAVPFMYGSGAPNDGFTLQTAATPSTSMSPRWDFATGGGDVNKGIALGGARNPRRVHVVAIALNQGLTVSNLTVNGVAAGPLTTNPGTYGWPSGQLRNYSLASIRALRSMVFYAEHDAPTRQAISRYLGNKYGAVVA